ncbi:MAG: glycosyltransferase family 39 protein [Anaerolineae bacterium]|nr:glycosyltransferase family 39 protein [Anaerolineae bacterium]
MVNYSPLRRWEWISAVGILLLAAFLRLHAPDITEFKRDEATLSRLSLNLAQGKDFPVLGIGSSVGFPNSPMNVYLLAIPYAAGNNPILATLFVGFLNVLAVALTWRVARRYFGAEAALVAGFLYAVSPWAVIYSRKIWAQDMLPPFVIATVLTGLLGLVEVKAKRWAQFWHLPLLAITAQIHFAAVILAPISLLMVGLGWCRIRREFWFGLVGAVLLCMPFVYGLYQDDWLSLSKIQDSLERSRNSNPGDVTPIVENPREIRSTALDYVWFTIAGKNIHSLTGANQFQQYLDEMPPAYGVFNLVPIGVVMAALGLGVMAWRKSAQRPILLVLLVWLIVPVAAYIYTWTAVQPHYFIPMMPAAFIVVGAGVAQLKKICVLGHGAKSTVHRQTSVSQHRRQPLEFATSILVWVAFGVIGMLQIWLMLGLLNFLNTHDTMGGFGTPLGYLLDVRQTILDADADGVLVVSEGDSVLYDNEPAVWDALLDGAGEVRFVNPAHLWVVPAEPTLLLVSPTVDRDLMPITPEVQPYKTLALRPGEGVYQIWQNPLPSVAGTRTAVEAHFANGVVLESIWRDANELWLVWRVPDAQAGMQYIAFVHGLDAHDQKLGQTDLPFWPGGYWQVGDKVLVHAQLNLDGVQKLSIGIYRFLADGNYQNSELLDAEGRYLAQSLVIENQ